QALVLIAGVTFNILFAWILFTGSFMSGLSAPVGYLGLTNVQNAHVLISDVLPNSPAAQAGLAAGDQLNSVSTRSETLEGSSLTSENVQNLIAKSNGSPIAIDYERKSVPHSTTATAKNGLVADKIALGISMEEVGVLKDNPLQAIADGTKVTGTVISQTAVGLATFIKNIFVGHPDLSQVTGPVGIVNYVGEAYSLGFLYLIAFTSLISINLALINILPFPALDGGRLLFVIIESIKGSPIKPKVANALNNIGFALLILLMIAVTYHDIAKFFVK